MDMTDKKRGFTGWSLLMWLGGFFAVIFAVNAFFVYQALTTFKGVEARSAYHESLRFNDRLAEARAQEALGWQADLKVRAGAYGEATFTLEDANGAPVTRAEVRLTLKRPADYSLDQTFTLYERTRGVYTAPTTGLISGQWIAEITALGEDGEVFRSRNTLFLIVE